MNKIKLFVVVLVGVFSLVWITSVFAKPEITVIDLIGKK